jgi:hypothetical protein
LNKQLLWDAKRFEDLFNQFVRTQTDGHRLDERDDVKASRDAKCADYFFPNDGVIVELKTLNEDHGGLEYVIRLVHEATVRYGHPASTAEAWLSGRARLPKNVASAVDTKVQNSLKNMLRKANEQIKSTRLILKKRQDGILVVANLAENLFGPIELLRNIASHALGRTSLSIDAILLITPGVAYSAGDGHPQHYIAPVYAEDKTYLGDFIEPLVARWIAFEAASMGLEPEVEKIYELDESSKIARPVR